MADRYQYDDRGRRERAQRHGRQAEQFQSGFDDQHRDQMGESWRDDDYAQQSSWQSDERYDRERSGREYRGSPASGEGFGPSGYGGSRRSTSGGGRSFASFTGNDYGGRDFTGGAGSYSRERQASSERPFGSASYGAGSWLGDNHGEWRERDFSGSRAYGRDRGDDRGLLERAGDAMARWFGDDDDDRYGRRESYRGHGPAGYTRTDERIREDASERLTDDWAVDARKIEVTVSSGEITLNGTVTSRDQKRRAEDLVEDVSGVKHVQNNLRVDAGSGAGNSWERDATGGENGSRTSKTTTSR